MEWPEFNVHGSIWKVLRAFKVGCGTPGPGHLAAAGQSAGVICKSGRCTPRSEVFRRQDPLLAGAGASDHRTLGNFFVPKLHPGTVVR